MPELSPVPPSKSPGGLSQTGRRDILEALLKDGGEALVVEHAGAQIRLEKTESGNFHLSSTPAAGLIEEYIYDAAGKFVSSRREPASAVSRRISDMWEDDLPPAPGRSDGDKLLAVLSSLKGLDRGTATESLEQASMPSQPEELSEEGQLKRAPRTKSRTSWAQLARMLPMTEADEAELRTKFKIKKFPDTESVSSGDLLRYLGLTHTNPLDNVNAALDRYVASHKSAEAKAGDNLLTAWASFIVSEKGTFPTEALTAVRAQLWERIGNGDFPGNTAGEKAKHKSDCSLQALLLDKVVKLRINDNGVSWVG